MSLYKGNSLIPKIINSSKNYDMIFIGEFPHHNNAINKKVSEIVIELAKNTKFRIYAKELLFCLHPFLEGDSTSCEENPIIPESITKYNRSAHINKKIIVTAVDIAHSIKHSPHFVGNFIEYQLKDYQNVRSVPQIISLGKSLTGTDFADEKQKVIHQLRNKTQEVADILPPYTYEELMFYYHLLQTSLSLNELVTEEQHNLRNKWFIKTMEKAISRTEIYNSKMIFHVGSPHAYKKYINDDDYQVGNQPEAEYFNKNDNRVFSIQIRPFFLGYHAQRVETISDPVEKFAYNYLDDNDSVYLDLHEYQKMKDNRGIEKYYKSGEYQFDGIIYIKDNSSASNRSVS